MEPLRTLKVGLDSLLLEFGSGGEVVEAFRSARSRRDEGLLEAIEIIPAARTLLLSGVEVDRVLGDLEHWGAGAGEQQQPELIELPIRYDGPDIESVARLWDCTAQEAASFHSSLEYSVDFCGFAPGFAYCSGLPEGYEVPRLTRPRSAVPARSVGLAAGYTGVYPRASPGGCQLIGSVDIPVWQEGSGDPALLRPGCRVRFVP